MTTQPGSRPLRVVMFVYNDVSRDSRVLREAASLVAAGHTVTIMGRPSDPEDLEVGTEHRDGFRIVRVPVPRAWRVWRRRIRFPWRTGRWIAWRMSTALRRGPAGLPTVILFVFVALAMAMLTVVRLALVLLGRSHKRTKRDPSFDWLMRWRFSVLSWADAAAAAAPQADVYHGHDLTGLPAAVRAKGRRGGLVVYDSHELFLESGSNASRPRWAKLILGRLERHLAAQTTALVTVNRTLGQILAKRFSAQRVVVVHNCPPRWSPPPSPVDLLRPAAGISADTPVVLYHGGFTRDRGLLELADSMLEPGLDAVHLVYLGYGPLDGDLKARAEEARSGGRIHVLAAVAPDVLPEWVAAADVGAMPNQPRTENELLSTPNKLFESLAVGLPVVSSDFPERRAIVMDDPAGPLGAVCDPTDVKAIAAAIRSILDLGPEEREALRARCLRAAHERWNWETESARLVALYDSLALELAGSRTGEAVAAG
ncbi:MAG: glycosyltransferase [Candidatus Limnocylindrales bacterium]|nr:glycosyltransferase [Candidatus Limnocylindrales bacterium]